MDLSLSKAVEILNKYYKLHYDYPNKDTTIDFQEIKYAIRTVLKHCQVKRMIWI